MGLHLIEPYLSMADHGTVKYDNPSMQQLCNGVTETDAAELHFISQERFISCNLSSEVMSSLENVYVKVQNRGAAGTAKGQTFLALVSLTQKVVNY